MASDIFSTKYTNEWMVAYNSDDSLRGNFHINAFRITEYMLPAFCALPRNEGWNATRSKALKRVGELYIKESSVILFR